MSMSHIYGRTRAISRLLYGLSLRLALSQCGKRFLPSFPLTIIGGENIKIGDNFTSMGHDYLYADDGYMEIGNNFRINTNVQIGASSGKIIIGNNVLIGPNVVLRAADHGLSRNKLIMNQTHKSGEIIVEDDVWIGSNAVILQNVRLARGCVVAAGAVVTKNVESYTIVGGVPARKIADRL